MVGRENVPERDPLIVAADRHNSIVDAMLRTATFERPLHVLANAPLFRQPLVGPSLRLMGGLPVDRSQEVGGDPEKRLRRGRDRRTRTRSVAGAPFRGGLRHREFC